jgi:hypothetical protein
MKRKLLLLGAIAACAAALAAFRPYNQGTSNKAAWLTVSSLKTGQEYYLEVAQDGSAVLREETAKTLVTRRGKIKPMLVKDFFREIDNSEIINSQNVKQSKMVFYRGDMIRISAYISGELTLTEAPLNNFGEAFSYAFGEVKKAVSALPEERSLAGFLRATPVNGDAMNSFREKAPKVDGEIKNIETEDIRRVKPLMAAIKEPYRLIPLQSAADTKELQNFVSAHQLVGLRTQFYIPSTRGTFKCDVVDAVAKPAPAQKPAPAPAAKPKAKK